MLEPVQAGGNGAAPVVAPVDPAVAVAAAQTPEAFLASLPEDIRADPAFKPVTGLENLARQYIDQQQHLGNALRVPGPDAGQEAMTEFHRRILEKTEGRLMPTPDRTNAETMGAVYDTLGRPESAEHYIRPQVEGAPEVDPDSDKAFAGLMHEQGLSQGQFEALYGAVQMSNARQLQAQGDAAAASAAALKQEWGYTYDGRIEGVIGMAKQFGFSDAVIENIGSGKAGEQDTKAFHALLTQLTGESNTVAKQPGHAEPGLAPNEALLQINEIMNRPEYHHHDAAVRQPLIDKIQQLQKFANPNAVFDVEGLRRGVTTI